MKTGKKLKEEGHAYTHDEFLSKMKMNHKLIPVITFEMMSCEDNEKKLDALISKNEERYSFLDKEIIKAIDGILGTKLELNRFQKKEKKICSVYVKHGEITG